MREDPPPTDDDREAYSPTEHRHDGTENTMTPSTHDHDRDDRPTIVFAFDRDWTVDLNPHPRREAVPLEWVEYLAHETGHPVYAIGNQDLADEAAIPGVVDVVGRHPDDWDDWLGDKQPDGYYEQFPERRERLSLIEDLHPDASAYVVVDDLDLSDVAGWDHYHAWDFVPAVKQGELNPDLPWVREPVTDGGVPVDDQGDPIGDGGGESSENDLTIAAIESPDHAALAEFLDEHSGVPGYDVAIDDGDTRAVRRCYDVSVIDQSVERPSAEPVVWCTPIEEMRERYHLPVDDIQRVTAVGGVPTNIWMSYEQTPTEEARALRELAADHPDAVDVASLVSLLDEAAVDTPSWADETDDERRTEAVTALRLVAESRPLDCAPAIPLLGSLLDEDGPEATNPDEALKTLRLVAQERPADVAPLVEVIGPYSESKGYVEMLEATRCLMEVAHETPADVADSVPELAAALERVGPAKRYAVYALTCIGKGDPDAVEPITDELAALVADDSVSDGVRLNATSALGRVVSEYPHLGVAVVDDVATLFDAENAKLRNNAVGLVGDVAKVHTDVVEPHTEDLRAMLSVEDTFTRINASAALGRIAGDFPASVVDATEDLVGLLDDDHEQVRENACWALGRLGESTSGDTSEFQGEGAWEGTDDPLERSEVIEALERTVREDEHPDVCQRAQWALDRIRTEVGSQ